jgi:hypothetical protein
LISKNNTNFVSKQKYGILLGVISTIISVIFFINAILIIGSISIMQVFDSGDTFLLLLYYYLLPFNLIQFIVSFLIFRTNFKNGLIFSLFSSISIIIVLISFSNPPQYIIEIQSTIFHNILLNSGFLICFFVIDFVLIILLKRENPKEVAEIKRKILDLSTKLTRVEVKEIAERVKTNRNLVKKVMRTMLENREVYGKYFSSSRALVFNQKVNIAEIDHLMTIYKDWEKNEFAKKYDY